MKALVVFQKGETPKYVEDFPEPVSQNENEILISVKAAAIKHLDRMQASGKHYSTEGRKHQAKVVGGDGVGILEDGTRVYAVGISGMVAEKAIVAKDRMVSIPDALDNAIAAALPNAVMGSALALKYRATMKPGETVLINGATGVTGKVAVQIAKHYGAGKIIVTGRNEETLQSLLNLGADEIVSLKQEDENFVSQIQRIHQKIPIDIVMDYLWGHSAELILNALKGNGSFTHKTRYVSIGAMTGDKIELPSGTLRSTDLQLLGSGIGSWSRDNIKELISNILPEMFQLAAEQKLTIDTTSIPLNEIEKIWNEEISNGKRLVITI